MTCNLFSKIYPNGFKQDFKVIFVNAIPMILSNYSAMSLLICSLIYCGHIGSAELSAVTLAITIIDIVVFAVFIGLSSACETLFPQMYGGKNKTDIGIVLQKGLIISLLASFISIPIMLNCKNFLNAIKIEEQVTENVHYYLLLYIPSVFLFIIINLLSKYIQAQNIVYPVLIMNLIANLINVGFHEIFVNVLNLSVKGAAISVTLSNIILLITLFSYIYFSKLYVHTWNGWSWKCLEDWKSYLKLSIPGMIIFIVEWMTFEIGSVLAGTKGTQTLSIQAICLQVSIFSYMIPLGFSMSGNIRIGHYLGSNRSTEANNAARILITIGVLSGLTFFAVIFSLSKYLPYIFTKELDIIQQASGVIVVVSCLHILDSINLALSGIIKSIGAQIWASIMIITSFYVFGLPIGVPLLFYTQLDLYGFWIGMIVAGLILLTLQTIFVFRINWPEEGQKAAKHKKIEAETIEMINLAIDEHYVVVKRGGTNGKTLFKRILVLILMLVILTSSILTMILVKVDGKKDPIERSSLNLTKNESLIF